MKVGKKIFHSETNRLLKISLHDDKRITVLWQKAEYCLFDVRRLQGGKLPRKKGVN